mmetsp:Transcript_51262/g.154029  ORF Transcript_51262/g.154029 Transcript_51262/m.154029 type:complete len:155 (-) Transcript_51262:188-652(-)
MICEYNPQFLARAEIKRPPGEARVGGHIALKSAPTSCGEAVAEGTLKTGQDLSSDQEVGIGNDGVSIGITIVFPSKKTHLFHGSGGGKSEGSVMVLIKSVIGIRVIADAGIGTFLSAFTPSRAEGQISKSTPGVTIFYRDSTKPSGVFGKYTYK